MRSFYVLVYQKALMMVRGYIYYDLLIKFFQDKVKDLLNIRDKSRFINRYRFINEVSISGLDYNKYYTFYIE